ncbi:MAG: PhoPQ-activated pathogenicity-related family protein [Bacteroidales bacterium]|nr:PhoPQ-activated pathogenicity-related family protein [Bacteroidales bacterium]
MTSPENALEAYLGNKDKTFGWEVRERIAGEECEIAVLRLTSQEWRGIKWVHQLTVITPDEVNTDGALLFITGGSNRDGEPRWKDMDDELLRTMAAVSRKNSAVVAIVSQVPNQPLFGDLTEDALISYTLHNFKNDRDFTWPLLFPMTKSAVRAMDAVQDFEKKDKGSEISNFVVSGASKRGWTTWLTGSWDKRVSAIIPMVIDVLNMPVNIDYQKKVWGDYSTEIEDYVKLGLAQDLSSPEGSDLAAMIDPWSYRADLAMPKLIMMGTNDEYWPADAIKNYIYDIPGRNFIHYEPNVGHDIGDGPGAIKALSAFFSTVVYGRAHDNCDWEVESDKNETRLTLRASPGLLDATLWKCDSPDQDFRNDKYYASDIQYSDPAGFKVVISHPETGFRAFYVELTYPDPVDGTYSKTTRMFVADSDELFLK